MSQMKMRPRGVAGLLILSGLLFCAMAGTAWGTVRWAFGPRAAYINIRWSSDVDDFTRQLLERRYRLSQGTVREGRTWGYALNDLSRDNIRALVSDASVEDTHQIDRAAFRVVFFAERLPYRTDHPNVAVGLEIFSVTTFLCGIVLLILALVEIGVPGVARRLSASLTPARMSSGLFVVLAAGFIILYNVALRAYSALLVEDGLVENATAMALVIAGILFAASARRKEGGGRYCAATFSLLLLVAALEEISWGQRIFGLPVPAFFIRNSAQSEINIHNTLQGFSSISPKHVVAVGLLLYALVIPRLLRDNKVHLRGMVRHVIFPPTFLAIPFITGLCFMADVPTGNEEEIGEFLLSLALCLFGGHEFRHRAESAPDHESVRGTLPPAPVDTRAAAGRA